MSTPSSYPKIMLSSYPKISIELDEMIVLFPSTRATPECKQKLINYLFDLYGPETLEKFDAELRKIHCIFGIDWKELNVGTDLQGFMEEVYYYGAQVKS